MSGNNGVAPGAGEASAPMTFDRMVNGEASVEETVDEKDSSQADDAEDVSEESEPDGSGEVATEEGDGGSNEGSDDAEADPSEEEAESEDKEEGEEDKLAAKDLEEVTKAAKGKTVTAKLGDKEYKIPADLKFSVTKNGKTIEFSPSEIGNNLLTSQEIDQQFTKLDREKKTFERDKRDVTKLQIEYSELEDSVGLIKEAAHRGNMFEVAQATLNVFSKGDADVSKQLFEQLVDLAEKVSAMSEDQLKASVNTAQLNFSNTKLKKEKEAAERKLSLESQRTWLHRQLSSKGIDLEEYRERYQALKELDKVRVEKGQKARLNENMTFEEIANETVAWTMATRVFNKVVGAISKVDPSQKNNSDLIEAVAQLTEPSSSEKDIIDIVREVLGPSQQKKIVSKAKDSSKEVSSKNGIPAKGPVKKEATPQKAPKAKETKKDEGDGPVTFSTLINRYS